MSDIDVSTNTTADTASVIESAGEILDLDRILMEINIKQQRQPRRVKIYHLDDDDESWEDQGTGFCYGYIDSDSHAFIVVEKEEAPDTLLLKEFISGNTQYQKQQDTLIVWTDSENNDIALSFQEQDGCELICDFIIQVQRYLQPKISLIAVISASSSENESKYGQSLSESDTEKHRNVNGRSSNNNGDDDNNGGTINELICGPVELPMIPQMDLDILDSILNVLQMDSMSRLAKNEICKFLSTTPEFLNEMILIFQKCEKLKIKNDKEKGCKKEETAESLEKVEEKSQEKASENSQEKEKEIENNYLQILYKLCDIVKSLVLYNENEIFDILFNENDYYIFNFIGILEYDPEFPTVKAKYREYLQDKNRFKEVFPVENQDIKKLIMTTFNLQFLKDVVLLRLLDDSTVNTMSTVIYLNQVEILKYLQNDEDEFLSRMFDLYKETNSKSSKEKEELINVQTKRDAIKMIHQYVIISKSLENNQRSTFFQILVNKGLLQMLKFALSDSVMNIRVIGTEIIIAVIEQDPLLISNINIKAEENIKDDVRSIEENKNGANIVLKDGDGNAVITDSVVGNEKEENLNDDERLAIVEYVEFVQSNNNIQETPEQQEKKIKEQETNIEKEEEEEEVQDFEMAITKSIFDTVSVANIVFLSDDVSLLTILVNLLITENDKGLITQVYHAIKVLLDPNNFQNNLDRIANGTDTPPCQYDNSKYLLKFYEDVAKKLFNNFTNNKKDIIKYVNDDSWSNYKLLTYQCELLTLCVHEHDIEARSFILENNILLGIGEMLQLKKLSKVVKLAILRCIRDIILLNDEIYSRYIINHKIFKFIFQLLWDNYKINESNQTAIFNLVGSSILEIFNLIIEGNQVEIGLEQMNYKLLIIHLNELFLNDLQKLSKICTCGEDIINHFEAYESQKRKVENNSDLLSSLSTTTSSLSTKRSLKRKFSVSEIKLVNGNKSLIESTNIHNNETCKQKQENNNKKVKKLKEEDSFSKNENETKLINIDVYSFKDEDDDQAKSHKRMC